MCCDMAFVWARFLGRVKCFYKIILFVKAILDLRLITTLKSYDQTNCKEMS